MPDLNLRQRLEVEMVRSRESVLLEFDQLLNLFFSKQSDSGAWFWKECRVENAFESFSRDAMAVMPRRELHQYAVGDWLSRRGCEGQTQSDIHRSLRELLDTQLPLKS